MAVAAELAPRELGFQGERTENHEAIPWSQSGDDLNHAVEEIPPQHHGMRLELIGLVTRNPHDLRPFHVLNGVSGDGDDGWRTG